MIEWRNHTNFDIFLTSLFWLWFLLEAVRTYLISNFIPQIVDIIHFLVDLAMFNLWNIFRRTWMFPNGMIFRPNFLGNSNRSKTFSKKVSKESIIVLIEKLESRQKDVQTFDPFFRSFQFEFSRLFLREKKWIVRDVNIYEYAWSKNTFDVDLFYWNKFPLH